MVDATPGAAPPTNNRNLMILLSYLWLLALIPLVVEKDDRELQWHAKHGLVLAVAELLFWIGYQVILFAVPFILGFVLGLLGLVIGMGMILFHIFAVIKGINGQRLIVPGVSHYADRF